MWCHVSRRDIPKVYEAKDQTVDMKPRGLYFGRDDQWVNWTRREGFKEPAEGDYLYEGTLHKDARVLHLRTMEDLDQFVNEYHTRDPELAIGRMFAIFDWARVAEDYDAFVMEYRNLYNVKMMMDPHTFWISGFISSFDVDTLVVFRPSALASITLRSRFE